MAQYLDYAAGTIPASAIVAAKFQGTIRYITSPGLMNPPGHNQKHMTPVEYADHKSHGLTTLFIYQGGTGDADTGRAGGVINAQRALAGMKYLGTPLDTPCFVVNDRTTLPSPTAWQEYLKGARSVLGRVGAYGFRNAIDAAWGIADWYWQCGSESAVRPGVHLYQHNNDNVRVGGQTCDINDVRRAITPTALGDDLSFSDEINITAPADRNYSEKHPASQIVGDTYYWTSDMYQKVLDLVPAVAAIAAAQTVAVDYDRIINGVVDKLTGGQWQLDIVTKATP